MMPERIKSPMPRKVSVVMTEDDWTWLVHAIGIAAGTSSRNGEFEASRKYNALFQRLQESVQMAGGK